MKTCICCGSTNIATVRDLLNCQNCHLVQPASPNYVAIDLDLLCDLSQVCYWLHEMSRKVRAGEAIDLDLLDLMVDQSKMVQAWASEFLPAIELGEKAPGGES